VAGLVRDMVFPSLALRAFNSGVAIGGFERSAMHLRARSSCGLCVCACGFYFYFFGPSGWKFGGGGNSELLHVQSRCEISRDDDDDDDDDDD